MGLAPRGEALLYELPIADQSLSQIGELISVGVQYESVEADTQCLCRFDRGAEKHDILLLYISEADVQISVKTKCGGENSGIYGVQGVPLVP